MKCTHVVHPQDCGRVEQCQGYEECYVRKYVTDSGRIWYDSGCADVQKCRILAGIVNTGFGRRKIDNGVVNTRFQRTRIDKDVNTRLGRTQIDNGDVNKRFERVQSDNGDVNTKFERRQINNGDTVLCEQCCNNTDLCNTKGICGVAAVKNQGPLCFQCQDEATPDGCDTITMCSQHQKCFLQRKLNSLIHEFQWSSGCASEQKCKAFELTYQSGGQLCNYCCGDDICNVRCRSGNSSSFTNMSTTKISTIKPTTTMPATTIFTMSTTKVSTTIPATTIRTPLPTTVHTPLSTISVIQTNTATISSAKDKPSSSTVISSPPPVLSCAENTLLCGSPSLIHTICTDVKLRLECPVSCGLCLQHRTPIVQTSTHAKSGNPWTTGSTTPAQTSKIDPFSACNGQVPKDAVEFYLIRTKGFLPDFSNFKLILSSSDIQWLVLFNQDIGICHNITVYNTSQTIDVPKAFQVNRNKIETKGIYVITSSRTSLQAIYKDPVTTEGYSVIPKGQLSTVYIVPSYIPNNGEAFVGIVSTTINTSIYITLKMPTSEKIIINNMRYGNGDVISIILPERGTFELSSQSDLTGTLIEASNNIGVVTGADGSKVPVNSGSMNMLTEMIPPITELGTEFLIPPLFENMRFIIRIIAAFASTSVRIAYSNYSGTQLSSLTIFIQQFTNYDININSTVKITADRPIMVVYYQSGDSKPVGPLMTIMKPVDNLGDIHDLTVPDDGMRHHILITYKAHQYLFLMVDGKSVLYKAPYVYDTHNLNSSYVVARIDVSPGFHTIGSLYPSIVQVNPGVILYADSDQYVAYGYTL